MYGLIHTVPVFTAYVSCHNYIDSDGYAHKQVHEKVCDACRRAYCSHGRMTCKTSDNYGVGSIKEYLQYTGEQHGNGKEDD